MKQNQQATGILRRLKLWKEANSTSGDEDLFKRDEDWNSKLKNKIDQIEERISDIEDRNLEMTQMEEEIDLRVKEMERTIWYHQKKQQKNNGYTRRRRERGQQRRRKCLQIIHQIWVLYPDYLKDYYKSTIKTQLKIGKGILTDVSQKKICKLTVRTWKMLNIINHLGVANQNQEMPPHTH